VEGGKREIAEMIKLKINFSLSLFLETGAAVIVAALLINKGYMKKSKALISIGSRQYFFIFLYEIISYENNKCNCHRK
jgi:hypothetical protein